MHWRLRSIPGYAFVLGMVTDLIERIRAALRKKGVTAVDLAHRAGLHRNTLSGVDGEEWNPTAATLKAIEPHLASIEADTWVPLGPDDRIAA